jgi:hypothetical protein
VRRSGGKREEVRSSGGGRGCVEAGGGKEKHGRGGRKWGKKLDPIVEEEQKKINSSQATINALKLDMSLKNENGEIAVRIQIFFPRQRF